MDNAMKYCALILMVLSLSACNWSITGSITRTTGSTEQKIEATIGSSSGMLSESMSSLLSTIGGFSYPQWSDFDPSTYKVVIDETNSYTVIVNNEVTLVVKNGAYIIGENSFPVSRSGNVYSFSNPLAVKDWAYQFIDVATNVSVSYELDTTTLSSSVVTVGAYNGSHLLHASSYEENICHDGENEFICMN